MRKTIVPAALVLGLTGFSQANSSTHSVQNGQRSSCPDTLTDPLYQAVKDNFLNIDFCNFAEYKISDHVDDANQDFPAVDGNNDLGLETHEAGSFGWYTFGGSHLCDNNGGDSTLCRFSTGGSPRNRGTVCGSSVNNDYQYALANPANYCQADQWATGSGTRLWFGVDSNNTYIAPLMGVPNHSLNRFCVEIELPVDRLDSTQDADDDFDSNPDLAQIVNQDRSNDNLDWLTFEFGTYTSVFKSDTGTNDEETGGTMQRGGSHFYHKPTSYSRYPNDAAYAISDDTFLVCMADSPSGVRSGMRPSYNLNPLMTVMGVDDQGQSDGFQYMPYLARIYLNIRSTLSKHPWTAKYNSVLMFYEFNDIFAMSGEGAVVGVDMIEPGDTAYYPFTVYNWAPGQRTYRVTMMNNAVLALREPSSRFKIFIDANANGQLDASETTEEILPHQLVTLEANTDLHLVATYTSVFDEYQGVATRFDREFAPAGVTFKEVGRLRSTSYAFRTWKGTAADVANKAAILPTISNPGPDSEYIIHQQWNHRKPNNNRLIKNSPDFLRALQKRRDNIGMLFRDGFE